MYSLSDFHLPGDFAPGSATPSSLASAINISHFDTALDVQASRLFARPRSNIRHSAAALALLIGTFHPLGHVFVTVIGFVDLFHAIERLLALAHFLVNNSEVIHDFLFH